MNYCEIPNRVTQCRSRDAKQSESRYLVLVEARLICYIVISKYSYIHHVEHRKLELRNFREKNRRHRSLK